jgi:hypothetical protein
VKWVFGAVGTFCVIVVLFLASVPVGSSKEQAKRSSCLSNVKMQAAALQIYAADYDERLPNRDSWMDAITPYGKFKTYPVCYEVSKLKHPQYIGYCFNRQLSNSEFPADLQTTPLVFESTNMARNASGGLESLPVPGRHFGSNNVAYADGYAKSVKMP